MYAATPAGRGQSEVKADEYVGPFTFVISHMAARMYRVEVQSRQEAYGGRTSRGRRWCGK